MKRKRLTITLRDDIIRVLDNFIDGARIRNRSHAIEYILNKHLFSSNVKVIILAGGKGIKLRPITYELPKALIPIHEKPLLEHTIKNLNSQNLKDIIISTGYLGEKIKNHFADGSKFGVKITYSQDLEQQEGTVSPLLNAKDYLKGNSFIVLHGDVLSQIDFLDLLEFHKQHKGFATMAVTSVEKPSDWGVAYMQGTKITQFKEKPQEKVSSHLINAGVYVFDEEIFKYLSPNQKNLSRDIFPKLAEDQLLFGYPFRGQWHDIGTTEAYEKAIKEWRN